MTNLEECLQLTTIILAVGTFSERQVR